MVVMARWPKLLRSMKRITVDDKGSKMMRVTDEAFVMMGKGKCSQGHEDAKSTCNLGI